MARRDHSFRPRQIASQHPRLLALSSAAVVAGMSLTQRLIRQQSRRRSIDDDGGEWMALGPEGGPEPGRAAARLPAPPPPGPDEQARPDPGLQETYRQGRRAVRRLRQKPGDEQWQELRRQSGELWHRVELLAASSTDQMRQLARQARRLSTLLSRDHDLAALGQRVREHPSELGAEDLELIDELINRRRGQLRRKAWPLANRLYRRKPARFARDLGLS